jgi:phosphotransferase system  glucose/maltose/N-acetylglucosamine-specific IIC component|tara:strand:- start:928 stop:1155 length:228 start_codon:yes stop_codon:yes gene_type:complete
MKEFFYAIENLFVNYLFKPFDFLREVGDYNWWLSNFMVWIFLAIGSVAFFYWMIQLKKFDKNNEEDMTITAHDYL